MKAIEDKDNASEERSDGRAEEKGEKDDSNGKVEVKEVSKEDEITVGTFGFAEKAVKSSTSKDENPSTVTESEKKKDQSKEGESAKEEKNEKLVEVTIEKAGEVCTTSSEVNPVSVSPYSEFNNYHMIIAGAAYECSSCTVPNNLFCRMTRVVKVLTLQSQLRKIRCDIV